MDRRDNGDFIIDTDEELSVAMAIGREEGRDWIYVESQDGYDGYCIKDGCSCTGHINYF